MNRKIIGIFGILVILLLTTITLPVMAGNDEDKILAEKHILAIGTFSHCDTNEVVYGYVLIGFSGLQPFFNTYIQICDNSIQSIVMTNYFLYCVYNCEG